MSEPRFKFHEAIYRLVLTTEPVGGEVDQRTLSSMMGRISMPELNDWILEKQKETGKPFVVRLTETLVKRRDLL